METSDSQKPFLSVSALAAEREARRRRDREAEQDLKQKEAEELAAYKKRLDEFQVTDAHRERLEHRLRSAFERGEKELMLVSFPSSLCTDGGRAVNNADLPPIVKPDTNAEVRAEDAEPAWLATLPRGIRPIYEFWKQELKPGGFGLNVRIINYPGGRPGDVGVFFAWAKTD